MRCRVIGNVCLQRNHGGPAELQDVDKIRETAREQERNQLLHVHDDQILR